MHRLILAALPGAWITIATACVEPGELGELEHDTSTAEAHAVTLPEEPPCDYITCGRNTGEIGNGQVDHIYFDGAPNARGQQFLSWRGPDGEAMTPVLSARSLASGPPGPRQRVGTSLNGSVITLVEKGEQVKLRFVDAREVPLPNGLTIWVYRLDVWRSTAGWRPLCPLFGHTNDDIARYAIPGTREIIHSRLRTITLHEPTEGKLTLGCPNTATGKMLSLGALRTTAIASEESTLPEMRATLLALMLSPRGGLSYTRDGVGVMFHVRRTGVDNNGETLSGGVEGLWDSNGAICFDRLRGISSEWQWKLWSDTHVPPCSEVDLSQHEVLVRTDRYFGIYPDYPPPFPSRDLTL